MKDFSDSIYKYLYSSLGLQTVGLVVGVLLVALHLVALVKPEETKAWLKKLPRSQSVGTWVLTLAFVWAEVVATSMDLGEFSRMRYLAQGALPVMYLSLLFYTNEYLGARSVGILALLVACPILEAAHLLPPQSRLLLPALAYVWVLLGLFWVGMPFTMRDQIDWVTKTAGRFKIATLSGIGYGVLLIVCAIVFWKGF